MGGRRRLKANAPRLLGQHDGRDGRVYRRAYDALESEFGPFRSQLQRNEAGRVAATWLNLQVSTQALAAARRTRERGKGRRPSAQAFERLARRQGLSDGSYAAALDRLRELVGRRNGHGRPSSPAELLAELSRQGRDP